jgi:hypothetical protein
MAGKYTPLEHYLREIPANKKEVTLTFEHIEEILSDKLPPSAYEYWAWWAHEKSPHQPEKIAIMNAGWKVESVDFNRKLARLVRI